MPRLLEVADLCSRTVSDTANRLIKRTDSEDSSSAAEKKSSAVPLISQRSHVGNLRQTLKGKGRFTRGWKPQVSTLLCARAASAQFRSLLKRHSHVRERSENHRVETAGVYPLARRRGCGEPPPPKVGAHSICAGSSETAVYVLHRPQSCAKIILLWEKHSWSAQIASPRSLTSWSER